MFDFSWFRVFCFERLQAHSGAVEVFAMAPGAPRPVGLMSMFFVPIGRPRATT